MIHTIHHLRTVGEDFWREVTDMQARAGAYELRRDVAGGIAEVRPKEGSDVHLRFAPPASYTGDRASYHGRAWLVEGNLLALWGVTEETVTFKAGERVIDLYADGAEKPRIPMKGRCVTVTEHYQGMASDGVKSYAWMFSPYGEKRNSILTQTKEYDKTTTITYDYGKAEESLSAADKAEKGLLDSLTITRDGSTAEALTIASPVFAVGNPGEKCECVTKAAGSARLIEWTGEDCAFALRASSDVSHWVVLEPAAGDWRGDWPECTVIVMGDLPKRLDEMEARKQDKEDGKGLSANDYTDAEKAKLAGIETEANKYILPTASTNELGGVRVQESYGEGEEPMVEGAYAEGVTYTTETGRLGVRIPPASARASGAVRLGEGLELEHLYIGERDGGEVDGWARVKQMQGATAEKGGTFGAPRAPRAGEQDGFLRGDGSWASYNETIVSMLPIEGKPLNSMNIMTAGEAQLYITGAQAGVPFSEIRVYLTETAGEGYSAAVLTMADVFQSWEKTVEIDLVALTGGKVKSGWLQILRAGGMTRVTMNGHSMEIADIIQPASVFMMRCDVGTVGAYYRKSLTQVISELKSGFTNVYTYRGSVETAAALPATDNTAGDVWDVREDGMNYAWNGTAWDALGATVARVDAMADDDIDAICG